MAKRRRSYEWIKDANSSNELFNSTSGGDQLILASDDLAGLSFDARFVRLLMWFAWEWGVVSATNGQWSSSALVADTTTWLGVGLLLDNQVGGGPATPADTMLQVDAQAEWLFVEYYNLGTGKVISAGPAFTDQVGNTTNGTGAREVKWDVPIRGGAVGSALTKTRNFSIVTNLVTQDAALQAVSGAQLRVSVVHKMLFSTAKA